MALRRVELSRRKKMKRPSLSAAIGAARPHRAKPAVAAGDPFSDDPGPMERSGAILVRVPSSTRKALKQLALDRDRSLQSVMEEAINLVLVKHGRDPLLYGFLTRHPPAGILPGPRSVVSGCCGRVRSGIGCRRQP